MKRLMFQLRVVTPLFLSGADQQAVELRPPSIRGALRFWFRAMMGGVIGGDWQKVKELESEVFGYTKSSSRLVIEIESSCLDYFAKSEVKELYNPLPHKKEASFRLLGFKPDQTFCLILGVQYPQEDWALEIARRSLLLWLALGGIGRRSRRGFGSLILEKNLSDSPPLRPRFATVSEGFGSLILEEENLSAWKSYEDVKQYLIRLLNESRGSFEKFAHSRRVASASCYTSTKFPTLNANTHIVVCPKSFSSWNEALESLMCAIEKHYNPVFGKEKPRQASPLIVKVVPVSKSYHLILTAFLNTSLNPELRSFDWSKMYGFLNGFAKGGYRIAFNPSTQRYEGKGIK